MSIDTGGLEVVLAVGVLVAALAFAALCVVVGQVARAIGGRCR